MPSTALHCTAAYRDLVVGLDWREITLLYEDNAGLGRLHPVLQLPATTEVRVLVKQLSVDSHSHNLSVLHCLHCPDLSSPESCCGL